MINIETSVKYYFAYFNKDELAKECAELLEKYKALNDTSSFITLNEYKSKSIIETPTSRFTLSVTIGDNNVLVSDSVKDVDLFSLADHLNENKLYKNIYDFEYLEKISKFCIENHSDIISQIYDIALRSDYDIVHEIGGCFYYNKELYNTNIQVRRHMSEIYAITEDVYYMRHIPNDELPPIHIIRITNDFNK